MSISRGEQSVLKDALLSMAKSVRELVAKKLAPVEERITALENLPAVSNLSTVKEAITKRDLQLDRHAEHLNRLQTKVVALQTRIEQLENSKR